MLIETIVTMFVVGFVAIGFYGHVLVALALLGRKDGEAKATRERAAADIRGPAETHPAS